MNRLLIIVILLACNVSAWSQVDTCGCDCNIVEIFTDNTLWYPKLDADQDSFYQDGSGAGFDTDDRDPCAPLTNVGSCDQDGDGYTNSVDNCNFFYNPDQANNDSDSFGDVCDNCDFVDNEDQINSDGDSFGDACDLCPDDTDETNADTDGDGYGDVCDNCPDSTNVAQIDYDNDDVGDVCDNCVSVINTAQINSDADTLGDACDWCDLVTDNANLNSDGDSFGDVCDNCPNDTNEGQEDTDVDTIGNVCDNCPLIWNYGQADLDSDGIGDVCDVCPYNPNNPLFEVAHDSVYYVGSHENYIRTLGFYITPDGNYMFLSTNNDELKKFSLSTPYDITTAIVVDSITLDGTAFEILSGIYFSTDGTKFFAYSYSYGRVYQYSLSTAWDISTIVFSKYAAIGYTGSNLTFNSDGTKIYTIQGAGSSVDYIYQYSLPTAWDIGSPSLDGRFNVNAYETWLQGFSFSSSGDKLYLVGDNVEKVHQFDLSTNFDVTGSKTYDGFWQESPSGNKATFKFFFAANGLDFYYIQYNSTKVYQSKVCTP